MFRHLCGKISKKGMSSGLCFFPNETFCFEIVVDSRAVVRNNIEKSCVLFIQFPPMVISSKTVVQYHSHHVYISAIKIENISME